MGGNNSSFFSVASVVVLIHWDSSDLDTVQILRLGSHMLNTMRSKSRWLPGNTGGQYLPRVLLLSVTSNNYLPWITILPMSSTILNIFWIMHLKLTMNFENKWADINLSQETEAEMSWDFSSPNKAGISRKQSSLADQTMALIMSLHFPRLHVAIHFNWITGWNLSYFLRWKSTYRLLSGIASHTQWWATEPQ